MPLKEAVANVLLVVRTLAGFLNVPLLANVVKALQAIYDSDALLNYLDGLLRGDGVVASATGPHPGGKPEAFALAEPDVDVKAAASAAMDWTFWGPALQIILPLLKAWLESRK